MTTVVRVTRRVEVSIVGCAVGSPLPDGLTYLVAPSLSGSITSYGTFPHAPSDSEGRDGAGLEVVWVELEPMLTTAPLSEEVYRDVDFESPEGQRVFACTRSGPHELHVAHLGPGQPVAAWTDAPDAGATS